MTLRRRTLLAATSAALPLLAHAALEGLPTNTGHHDPSPHWERLRPKLFGDEPIATEAASQVQLYVPLRAAYGASVPIKIAAQRGTAWRKLWVVVDKNPSPIAAVLTLGPALPRAEFETRLRVDEYSHVRVIAQAADGSLHMDSRYVKVSGGCSAPPNRDHPELLGKTQLRLPEPGWAEVSTIHPNDTGFELNNITVMFIPPHFVREVRVTLGDALVFASEQDFSIAENPSWRFAFDAPPATGLLRAEAGDSKDGHYRGELPLPQR